MFTHMKQLVVPASFVKKTVLSPSDCSCAFVKNPLAYLGPSVLFCSVDLCAWPFANTTLS